MENIKYDIEEIAFGMSIEPYLKQMLLEENIKIIQPYELATLCMGVYEMYKSLFENDELLPEEENNLDLFINNYKFLIKENLNKLIDKYKEMQEIEEQNILYC